MRAHLLAMMVLATACGEADDEHGRTSPDDTCVSGLAWTGGNEESSEMHPGRDCIGCHARANEGPDFFAAGTVYAAPNEHDDCYGVEGVTVELTAMDGTVLTDVTNRAGNFSFAGAAPALPYTARVLYDGRVRPMAMPQSSGACATCHAETGLNGAPGRILAP